MDDVFDVALICYSAHSLSQPENLCRDATNEGLIINVA